MAASITSAVPSNLAVQLPRDLLVLALAHLVAADRVDGAAFGGGHQPGAGIGRNAGPGPFGQGDDQGILRQFLGKIDIAHDAGQTRDEPGPFDAKNRLDRPVRLACRHAALSAKAIGEAEQAAAEARFVAERRLIESPPSFPRSPSRGSASSSGVTNSARSAIS